MDSALQIVESHQRLFVLSGAGCRTNSGIPDYRDAEGNWKRTQPVRFQAFMAQDVTRRRHWARSMIGWRRFGQALPNDAHHALARLEARDRCRLLLTQNVDRLHQAAGSRAVIDLHGRLDLVRCTACSAITRRGDFQTELARLNSEWVNLIAAALPDGDADLDHLDFSEFGVPACGSCGGIQKPDVVFFDERIPRDQVSAAQAALDEADAMLVVGSSFRIASTEKSPCAHFNSWRHTTSGDEAASHRSRLGRRRLTLLTLKVAIRTAVLRTFDGGPRSSYYALRSQSD